mmetsp:Transcript_25841/g.30020  ORF Transcript_25841/g.30020 Transcript_25841/m.30020 type:complete len:266 (-) Transcript_25841:185-982(-)
MLCCTTTKPTSNAVPNHNVERKIKQAFPGAKKSSELASHIQKILTKHGYVDNTTLVATSLCCDEVDRDLEHDFTEIYNDNFNMGGLAGFAFGGVTSFGAMAHHIPNNGSCLVLYGPHVGVDSEGNVGKVNRRGRTGSGACCGSAAAAFAYVKGVHGGEAKQCMPASALDAQQYFVGNMLLPQAERIVSSDDADVELPLALFDVQDEFMKEIISKGCGEVAGEGKIALLGGIQINTPSGTSEYFLPKVFEIRNNKFEKVADLMGFF